LFSDRDELEGDWEVERRWEKREKNRGKDGDEEILCTIYT
jgi:hypothetical protein